MTTHLHSLEPSLPPEADCPPLEHFDTIEIPFDDCSPRLDSADEREALQLERRGVTSQIEFWRTQTYWKESIISKLDGADRSDLADLVRDCHTQRSVAVCCGCAKRRTFFNRCENKWCPECTPRLGHERKRAVEWWTQKIDQPKHVVLTARNATSITRRSVQAFKAAFSRLRRSAMARGWRGGFYSLEVTNEGRGWHLHLHALIDARFIDRVELARIWARCVGQDFAIVKVKDARRSDYLAEVTKYVVKGSQLASWTGAEIAEFIDAFTGVRTFGVFGTLYRERKEFREFLDQLQALKHKCDCGCDSIKILSETEALLADLKPDQEKPTARSQTMQTFLPVFSVDALLHGL